MELIWDDIDGGSSDDCESTVHRGQNSWRLGSSSLRPDCQYAPPPGFVSSWLIDIYLFTIVTAVSVIELFLLIYTGGVIAGYALVLLHGYLVFSNP